MLSPAAIRQQYGDLFSSTALPVLEELFQSEMAMHPSRRSQLFKEVSTDRDIWQYSEIHDMDLFSQVAEGADYSFKRSRQGANKTLTVQKYGLGVSVSQELVDDGKFDLLADMIRKLAASARESQEISAMNIFNNGFSTETTADGVALFSASHTLPSGLTFSNIPSAPADLSVTSLETALSDFETRFIGDSGIIKNIKPRTLLVHPNSKRYAMELIGSDLKADTADNNMNSIRADGLQVISSPHLTDTDAWFLLAAPSETGLRIVNRSGIETKAAGPDVGFVNDTLAYKSRYREIIAAVHAYGAYGTSGAG